MLIGPWIGSLISGTSSEGFLGVTDKNYSPKNLIFYAALVVGVFTYLIVLWVHNFKKKTGEENA
jgi:hypothetical protein